ncbi:hypothetical protein [Corallococcus sp. EGB]|uniref:hypothetical protein n=1 Tax=Corallococcus sp. EGB TaxID=1521117 RepID=UPI001CBEA9BC|nr:hypothetical protein [Corallococcus sp. EGB]
MWLARGLLLGGAVCVALLVASRQALLLLTAVALLATGAWLRFGRGLGSGR